MTEMELREEIRRYEPFNEQEREDKEEILRQMEQTDHILTRDNRNAHITVSAWIMDRDRKKVLMAYTISTSHGHGLGAMQTGTPI